MRISELAVASGVPVSTIKYYLRVGLLHRGHHVSATRARYDDGHLARLRLLRLLAADRRPDLATLREIVAGAPDAWTGSPPGLAAAEGAPLPETAGGAAAAGAWLDPSVGAMYQRASALIARADRLAVARNLAWEWSWSVRLQQLATEPYLRALRDAAHAAQVRSAHGV